MLEISQLLHAYDRESPLFFDLQLETCQCGILRGVSGAGKSTLLQLIAGFLTPLEGSIFWQGKEITTLPVASRPLSILFQSDNLFDHLDCWTNIAIGLNPSVKLSYTARDMIQKALYQLGLEGLQGRLPGQLSGGQQQRVALARCLVRAEYLGHHLLLLDEPFSALDAETRADSMAALIRLIDKTGVTVLMVSHDKDDRSVLEAQKIAVSEYHLPMRQSGR